MNNISTNILPKITIITPSFNQVQYIEKTITSILEQNYPNLEYIIIDGGSTDGTIDIIKKYESKITYWISEPDRGQSHAINKGLKIATGEIFNWINSDDYLEPNALINIAEEFSKNPQIKAVGGYCRLFGPDFSIMSRIGVKSCVEESIINYWMNQPSTFYKTEIIKEFGGVNESLHYCMDLELWFKFLAQYGIDKIHLSNHLYSHFRHHEDSKTEIANEKFVLEHKLLLYHLIQRIKLPDYVSKEFLQIEKTYYKPNKEWDLTHISYNIFSKWIANKYHHNFYSNKNKRALRWSLYQFLKNREFQFNRYFLSLLFKSLLSL